MSAPAGAVRIRPATIDDVEALAEIYLSSARHHATLDPAFYRVPERQAVARHLRDALSADDSKTTARLAAEIEGAVVGSADVELRSPGPASMVRPQRAANLGIAVLDAWRGRGVGSQLMEAAESWAREQRAGLMLLDASAANEEARRFYEERHGFRLRGVLMAKELDPAGGRR
ncbi:MAG TPA: GNAT family N-acetyltransferase [Candidatus Limnocylindrales bacterium]|nr:GNAT family N-acetyltransferase [Candidatus Limnocylindrales bacterium]